MNAISGNPSQWIVCTGLMAKLPSANKCYFKLQTVDTMH